MHHEQAIEAQISVSIRTAVALQSQKLRYWISASNRSICSGARAPKIVSSGSSSGAIMMTLFANRPSMRDENSRDEKSQEAGSSFIEASEKWWLTGFGDVIECV